MILKIELKFWNIKYKNYLKITIKELKFKYIEI